MPTYRKAPRAEENPAALVQFADTPYDDIRNQLREVINGLAIIRSIASITKHEFEEAGGIMGRDSREIEFVLKAL
ncbi:MAG: hypothetical protein KAU89_03445 [Candidatus Thorarchaeota archaeon]|nr:hypothetical protein [Candidatus Thorarchaeota archaeon]